MNEYMMDNGNGGYNSQMPGQDMEEIKSLLKKGNILKTVTLGSVIVLGGVVILMQIKNGKDISDISKDVRNASAEISEINRITDDIADNVYDIMEQGCNANNSANNTYDPDDPDEPYNWIEYGAEKPAIYIYSDEPMEDVKVDLSLYRTDMLTTWPEPDAVDVYTYTWNMKACDDGTLYDAHGNEFSYIFWEATDHGIHSFDQGFCVTGEDTAEFLKETLAQIGLNARESNDFIVYWLPRMQGNAYNLINFEGLVKDDAYNSFYGLDVTDSEGNPAQSVLRVLMVWKAVDEYTDITPQTFTGFSREGLTVVEWGGTELTE